MPAAAHVRELLARLDALSLQAPEGGSLNLALTDADGALRATTTLDQLRRLARRGCRQHPDRDCGCPMLDRPAPTDAYTPTAAQHALVTTRDRACRFPTCGQRVGRADRDHVIPHHCGGPTDCANLTLLCLVKRRRVSARWAARNGPRGRAGRPSRRRRSLGRRSA